MGLILGRRVAEEIILTINGVDINVKVKRVHQDNVHLEFTAPDNVVIDRKEIYLRKQQQLKTKKEA